MADLSLRLLPVPAVPAAPFALVFSCFENKLNRELLLPLLLLLLLLLFFVLSAVFGLY